MNRRGFTLIELLAVIAVMSILLAMATINFRNWSARQRVERQVREMYADIMSIRQQAMVTGNNHDFRFTGGGVNMAFRRYTSDESRGGGTPALFQKNLQFPVVASPANPVEFNHRGLTVGSALICVFTNENPSRDALVITPARISMGKIRAQGSQDATACTKNNIDLK